MKKFALLTLVALALSGCNWYDNRKIETPPVTLNTTEGPVICQLYREDIVWYDRAWVKPSTVTTEQANTLCRKEGERIKAGGQRDRTNRLAGFQSESSK